MKILFFIALTFFTSWAWSAQKAKIANPAVDIYSDSDFDSDILDTVKEGETYWISDKVYGPFYRIKLKSGKIGYIPDTDVDIAGKGRVAPRSENDDEESDDPFLQDMDGPSQSKNKNRKKNIEDEEEEENLHGITLQLVNYHEDTLGGVQVDDLPAIGYKSLTEFAAWEVIASFKAPKYYTEKLNASARAINVWASFGVSNEIPLLSTWSGRYAGGLMSHLSFVNVDAPAKSYDMQDLTVGAYIEGAFLFKIGRLRYDLAMKYIFDRQSYGALGFTLFF